MAIVYRIYSNRNTGGLVDYSTPVATTAGLTFVSDPLQAESDTTLVVRAFDTITNLEEANTDARVRIVVGADGEDISGLPRAPHALSIAPITAGGLRVSWAFAPATGLSAVPVGFVVYLTEGTVAVDASPVATVPFVPGKVGYSCSLAGPYSASTYAASVRSFNEIGIETNTSEAVGTLGPQTSAFAMEPLQVLQLNTTAV